MTPNQTTTDRLRRLLGTELTGADLDALDDDALRTLHNLLHHWHDMADRRIRRIQRRQQRQTAEGTT